MKKILGLDLGTTSIGWAMVNQAETDEELSSIIRAGVRVNPISTDEKDAFEKGKDVATNSDRRLKRSMRRNLQRYKQRRENLINLLKKEGWISDDTILAERGNKTTFETYSIRAKAPSEEISLSELARVLLMINKKRGYKSNRKLNSGEDGKLLDSISIAKEIAEKGITPGQYCLNLLKSGKKRLPEFYSSDLNNELSIILNNQSKYYPGILNIETISLIQGKGKLEVLKLFKNKFGILSADNKGKEKRIQAYSWRADAACQKVTPDVFAYVIADICGEIKAASGYLGAISDRSKMLQFNHETVGQYLYNIISTQPGTSLKNITFYRQDYIDEFEIIWNTQAKFHTELKPDVKKKIKDEIIFFQRRLKSQKALVSECEFEKHHKVTPKSSPVFQEFRLWQNLCHLIVTDYGTGEQRRATLEEMNLLAETLSVKPSLKDTDVIRILFGKNGRGNLNFKKIEGNTTYAAIITKLLEIVNILDDQEYDISKLPAEDTKHIITTFFTAHGYNKNILSEDTLFKLWHLLYSYEGDNSRTGNESLIKKIHEICSLPEEYAQILSEITFEDDYGNLSSRAIKKILPFLKEGNTYDKACLLAKYNHSHSETAEERDSKELVEHIDSIPKNSLRNPVVEKILNQMINVVNTVSQEYGKPDEIHIELARELKSNKQQRADIYDSQQARSKDNDKIKDILIKQRGFSSVKQSDIERYRLYEELKLNGYHTLYSNLYIPKENIFSKEIDIEHIIPQSVLFDDSFSNKTLEYRAVNIEKGNKTAYDYVSEKYGEEGLEKYTAKVKDLLANNKISRTKAKKLLMKHSELPKDFLERDLKNSQYISKKSQEILRSFTRVVVPTSGAITKRLREDWQLVNVLKELNMPKYEMAGITEPWTKRNDHRHHAMDALTIAFTKPSHIQYLNNLNSKNDTSSDIYGIMMKETIKVNGGRVFIPPMPLDKLRASFRSSLESILVSIKAKNKVVTRNVNKTRTKGGYNTTIELTPRGSLHKETIYGKKQILEKYEFPIGGKLTRDIIETVSCKAEREALLKRLEMFGGDPKKAFTGKNSPDKNPVWIDDIHSQSLDKKVVCDRYNTVYTIRKQINKDLNVDKVLDNKIRELLKARIKEYGDDASKAFANLDENPIWLNEAKRIPVKSVTIAENFEELLPIHDKKDNLGNIITDSKGIPVPADYVNLRNNHHIAIYEDAEGNYKEKLVTFYEALDRISNGLKPVDKNWKKDDGYKFIFSMKINEMFVFPNPSTGFDPNEINLLDRSNYALISPNLFRVQKLSKSDYWFRHHLETEIQDEKALKEITWKRITSINCLKGAIKVRINHIGDIVSVGEYD